MMNNNIQFPVGRIKSAMVNLVREMHEKEHEKRAEFLAVLLLDFGNAMKIGIHGIKGLKAHYQPYQLNPEQLAPDQLGRPATLLIHGWMHNQGVWKKMAEHLFEEEGVGALFTVNLPWRGSDEACHRTVQNRMRQINILYKRAGVRRPDFNLVGYSNGGMAAIYASEFASVRLKHQISKLVMIGCHLSNYYFLGPQTRSKVFAITASHDFLDTDICRVPLQNRTQVHSTHLGLLYTANTASALAFILKQD